MTAPSAKGKTRLVVLFGGRSAEHEVSCVTAASVLGAVDRDRYDVVPVGLSTEGRWVLANEAPSALSAGGSLSLQAAGPDVDPLPLVHGGAVDGPIVVLPLLHGPLGEDGTVQGMLELADVAYVGSGVLGSALCMDKAKAKEVLAARAFPQARHLARHESEIGTALAKEVDAELGWPVFVKPANLGSSVGITKVHDAVALPAALDLALAYDEWVVIEEAVRGRELECGVLGNDEPEASVVGEIIPSAEFYDYEDKYAEGGATMVIPAEIPEEVAEECRRLAIDAARALRVEGMARVDFFYEEGGRGLLVNEVNTIPGFTPHSMFPSLWQASGLSYPALIDRLVDLGVERHARRTERAGRARG